MVRTRAPVDNHFHKKPMEKYPISENLPGQKMPGVSLQWPLLSCKDNEIFVLPCFTASR